MGGGIRALNPEGDGRREQIKHRKSFIPKGSPDIARRMQDANDLRAVDESPIEDYVPAVSEATQLWRQLVAGPTEQRMSSQ